MSNSFVWNFFVHDDGEFSFQFFLYVILFVRNYERYQYVSMADCIFLLIKCSENVLWYSEEKIAPGYLIKVQMSSCVIKCFCGN